MMPPDRLPPTRNTMPVRHPWGVASVIALLLLALPRLLPADGQTHGTFEQFLGRFHPLAVHLPIALLLLLPLFEVAGRTRPALRDAAAFLLPCAALCTVGSVLLGVLLAHGGGFTDQAVRSHRLSAIALTLAVLLATLLRPAWQAAGNPWLYPATLTAVVLLTIWTGHQGGSITYGKGYLTRFAPSLLPRSRATYPTPDPASVYATRIQPILNANCVSCHGPAKRKGGLELDTYVHLMDGGTSGPVIAEGNPDRSILYNRITLPPSDRKFMPSQGKPPLTPQQIADIRSWIEQGASPLTAPTPTLTPTPTPSDQSATQSTHAGPR